MYSIYVLQDFKFENLQFLQIPDIFIRYENKWKIEIGKNIYEVKINEKYKNLKIFNKEEKVFSHHRPKGFKPS